MIDIDRWQEIYITLTHHKLRTSLTMFGVFWGIFMLVVLLGVGRSLERGALAKFGGHTNTIFMWRQGKTSLPFRGLNPGRRITLTEEDRTAILAMPEVGQFSSVNNVSWQANQYVERNHNSGAFEIRGVEPDVFPLSGYTLSSGRFVNPLDYLQKRKVAVIGKGVQSVLFDDNEQAEGEYLELGGINFKIVGVFDIKPGSGNQEEAERILIPNSSMRATFNQMGWYGYFQIGPADGIDANELEKTIKQSILDRHDVHPNDKGVLGVWNAQKEYDKVQGLFQGIRVFSWVVAIGTIIAGALGVGNIMLIIVKERTREIGVRKALGATPSNIVTTIIQEALVLTVFSGYLGLAAGVFTLEALNALFTHAPIAQGAAFGKADIDFSIALLALGTLTIAGLLASALPAMKAATVDPIVALQDQ